MANTFATRGLEDMLDFTLANPYARARVVFASSGTPTAAQSMRDDDTVLTISSGIITATISS